MTWFIAATVCTHAILNAVRMVRLSFAATRR